MRQTYYAMVDGAVEAFGGGLVASPMAVVFELQDLGLASNTPATVLYDGVVTSFAGELQLCCGEQRAAEWVDGVLQGDAGGVGVGG